MVIKIITLAPDAAQVQELLQQLAQQGLTASPFIGVDGRKAMPILQPDETIDQARSIRLRLIELTPSEVGCYLSHYRAIKQFYETGAERLCLLEDDVLPEESLAGILAEIEKFPPEVELIRLMGIKMHRRKKVAQLGPGHWLTRPLKGVCGTQGYVINREGMRKVIELGATISEPIDKFYDHFWDIDLHSYCVEPHLIWERPRKNSSVSKQSRNKAAQAIGKKIRRSLIKMGRGLSRRLYILRHWNDFFPAEKPAEKAGRTDRIH
jgi:glycosyl transferase family 25